MNVDASRILHLEKGEMIHTFISKYAIYAVFCFLLPTFIFFVTVIFIFFPAKSSAKHSAYRAHFQKKKYTHSETNNNKKRKMKNLII